jgi:hypothetical protein
MSDAQLKEMSWVLRAAYEPTRLHLLLHAHRHGSVHFEDAKAIGKSRLAAGSRTPSYHLGRLVTAGLLERQRRGEYALSPLARRLIRALENSGDARVAPSEPPRGVTLIASGDQSLLDSLLPPKKELIAMVGDVGAHTSKNALRVRRAAADR